MKQNDDCDLTETIEIIKRLYRNGLQTALFVYLFIAISTLILFGFLYFLVLFVGSGITINGYSYSTREENALEGFLYIAAACFTLFPALALGGSLFYALISNATNTNLTYRDKAFVNTETLTEALAVVRDSILCIVYCLKLWVIVIRNSLR